MTVATAIAEGPEEGRGVHMVPLGDLRPHVLKSSCWCRPQEDFQELDVWLHRSLDGRETHEEGRPMH